MTTESLSENTAASSSNLFGSNQHPFKPQVEATYELARYIFSAQVQFPQRTTVKLPSASPFSDELNWKPMSSHQGVSMKMLFPDRPNREQWKMSWLDFRTKLPLEDYKAVIESSSVRFQWDPALKGVEVKESMGVSVLVRSQIKGFWPVVGDRDLAIVMTSIPNEKGTAWLSMAHSVETERIPPNSSNVRANCTLAGFLIEYLNDISEEENHPDGRLVRLSYITQSDPRGMIPENVLTMLAHSQAQCVANIANYVKRAVPPPQVWGSTHGKFAGIQFDIKKNQLILDFEKVNNIPDGKRINLVLRIGTQLEAMDFEDSSVKFIYYKFVFQGHHFVWCLIDPKSLKADQVYRVVITQFKTASSEPIIGESVELAQFISGKVKSVHELWWNEELPDLVTEMLTEEEAKVEKNIVTPTPMLFDPQDQDRVNALLEQYSHLQTVDTNSRELREFQLQTDSPVLAVAQWLAMDPTSTMSDLTHSYLTSYKETLSKIEPLREPPVLLRMGISQYNLTHRRLTGHPSTVSSFLKFFNGSDSVKHSNHEWWRMVKWIQMHGESWKTIVIWQPDFIAKSKSKKGNRSSTESLHTSFMGSSIGFIVEPGENGDPNPGTKITVLSGKFVDLEMVQKFINFMGHKDIPYLEYPLPDSQKGEHEWKHCLVIHRVQLLHQSSIASVDDRNNLDEDPVVGIRFQCSIQQHATVSAPVFKRIRSSKSQPWIYYHMLSLNFPIKENQQRHIRMQSSHSLLSAYVQCVYENEKVFILFTDMKNRLPSGHDHSMALHVDNPSLFPMDLEIDAFVVKNGSNSYQSAEDLSGNMQLNNDLHHEWVYVNGVPVHSLSTFNSKDGAMYPEISFTKIKESIKKSWKINNVLAAVVSFLLGILINWFGQDFFNTPTSTVPEMGGDNIEISK